MLVCCGCEHVFAQSVSTNSEEYSNFYENDGNTGIEYIESIESWPAKLKRDRTSWFGGAGIATDTHDVTALDRSLTELYGALDHDLNTLAAIGVRTSFDIAAEVLGIDGSQVFEKKLDAMVQRKLIKESEREHLDTLIDAGSASAHRGWKPSEEDLFTLMDLLESFIYNSFVVPTQQKASAERVAKIRAKVPAKAKRAKPASKNANHKPK